MLMSVVPAAAVLRSCTCVNLTKAAFPPMQFPYMISTFTKRKGLIS